MRSIIAPRVGTYISIVVLVVVSGAAYSFRQHSLLACQASGYDSQTYLAYCGSTGYGDYDYGAFWFGLEPEASRSASQAEVVAIGNSRTQYGLSSEATREWFANAGASYFLLGFAYDGNFWFTEPLLRKLQPKARVYLVNIDLFFEAQPTPPARVVMRESNAERRYEEKKRWQETHAMVCSRVPALCGHESAFFRSRATGMWQQVGGKISIKPVAFDDTVDPRMVESYVASGKAFLATLPVAPECQILTVVPTVHTQIGSLEAVAHSLGRQLVAPQLTGLQTFDENHLDPPSAERWSTAFFREAGPLIQRCLAGGPSPSAAPNGDASKTSDKRAAAAAQRRQPS